ncbi:MAG: DUF2079 domain-containing protein [Candidatus Omnitrophica bacterium]|nr:DUF2079 domain-containing protein [Candidatus Omnitrophota bacterium]
MKGALEHLRTVSLKSCLYLISLGCIVVFYVAIGFEGTQFLFATPARCLATFLAGFALVFLVWWGLVFFGRNSTRAVTAANISLSPVLILGLLIPYNYFYSALDAARQINSIIIVVFGVVLFAYLCKNNFEEKPHKIGAPASIAVIVFVAVAVFGTVSVLRHLNFQNTSSFDVALYNQIQWNNIHGRFYQSSISGSNFVTHNSPFLILLAPFYAIYPHPGTLIFLKAIFLSVSIIPFYLILKRMVASSAVFPLTLCYVFFPFIVGQYFNAPHEICFLPPFLLFSFYFFLTKNFKWFLIFLGISLTVKEHLALVAVMYGVYALILHRDRRWVIVPVLLGVAWSAFSIRIIYFFQKIYAVDPYPAWLIENIKQRFLRAEHPVPTNVLWGLKTSVMGSAHLLVYVYVLFAPVALVFAFFSPVILLGLPELCINLLATVCLIYPTWHYNIIVSVFILIAAAESLVKFAAKPFAQKTAISFSKKQELLAWFLCLCVLCHSFLWWNLLFIRKDPSYKAAMRRALRMIPPEASVSAPKRLVAYVSTRDEYFLLEDRRKGAYIIMDHDERVISPLEGIGGAVYYDETFHQDGIRVYKRGDLKG